MEVTVKKNEQEIGVNNNPYNEADLHDWLLYLCDRYTDLGFYGDDIYQTIEGMVSQGITIEIK